MWQKAIFGVKNDLGLNINAKFYKDVTYNKIKKVKQSKQLKRTQTMSN